MLKNPQVTVFFGLDGRNSRSNQSKNIPPSLQGLEGPNKPYDSFQSGSSTASSQQNITAMGQYSLPSDYATHSGGSSHGTLGRRTGPGLRSFTVPIPPTGPLQPNIGIPQNSKAIRPMGIHHPSGGLQSSPIKRISASQFPISPSYGMMGMNLPGEASPIHKSYSTEDLSQEISNLEGLMKDLNAITASEFQC